MTEKTKYSPGDLIHGRYLAKKLLGQGGFSEVWKVYDQEINIYKAIKIYIAPSDGDADFGPQLFKNEKRITHRLEHPNLFKPHHFDKTELGEPYLLMDYVEGGSAASKIGEFNNLQLKEFLQQACEVLQYLHEGSPAVIHQDIKPENFLVDTNGKYMLCDFGISSQIDPSAHYNEDHWQVKAITPAFSPPEIHYPTGEPFSAAGDIWALGCTLHSLLTGIPAFGEDGGKYQSSHNKLPDLVRCNHEGATQRIREMMAFDPENRPSASEILEVLAEDSINITGSRKTVLYPDRGHSASQVTSSNQTVRMDPARMAPYVSEEFRKTRPDAQKKALVKVDPSAISVSYHFFLWPFLLASISLMIHFWLIYYGPNANFHTMADSPLVQSKVLSPTIFLYLISIISACRLLWQAWQTIAKEEGGSMPYKAVGFLFVPIFNFYWVFVAFKSLFNRMNRHHPHLRANEDFAALACLVMLIPGINLLSFILTPILLTKVRNNALLILNDDQSQNETERITSYGLILMLHVFMAINLNQTNHRIGNQTTPSLARRVITKFDFTHNTYPKEFEDRLRGDVDQSLSQAKTTSNDTSTGAIGIMMAWRIVI